MEKFIEFMRDFNIYTVAIRLVLALVLGALIGFERERRGHAAGFRTHILVSLGAAMTAMVGVFVSQTLNMTGDVFRISAQVISGIGFLGVGTILITGGKHVRGLTTAAGLWSTSAVGIAVGYGFYEGAVICMLLINLVMASFKLIDLKLTKNITAITVYFEVQGAENVNSVINNIKAYNLALSHTEVVNPKSLRIDCVGIEMTVNRLKTFEKSNIVEVILNDKNVIYAVELG